MRRRKRGGKRVLISVDGVEEVAVRLEEGLGPPERAVMVEGVRWEETVDMMRDKAAPWEASKRRSASPSGGIGAEERPKRPQKKREMTAEWVVRSRV